MERAAKNAIIKNLVTLNAAVSIDETTFLRIVQGCVMKGLITDSSGKELTGNVAIPLAQKTSSFINNISTTVGINHSHLDTFLVVLYENGIEVAKKVAKDYGYKLPKWESSFVDSSRSASNTVTTAYNEGLQVNEETIDGPLQEGQIQKEQQPTPSATVGSHQQEIHVPEPPTIEPSILENAEIDIVETTYTPDLVKDVDVILVTATDLEFRAVMTQATPLGGHKKFDQVSYVGTHTFYLAMYGQHKVAIIWTDQGGRNTIDVLDKVQEGVKAKYVIAVGICYGMNEDKVKLGDVIVAKHIMDFRESRVNPDHTRTPRLVGDSTGKHLCNIFSRSVGFKEMRGATNYVEVKIGKLASDTKLVDDQEEKDQILKQCSDVLGGEMEGAAIMQLADAGKFEGIVVKAVADYGNGKKRQYKKWQKFAAVTAAKYVKYHLDKKQKGNSFCSYMYIVIITSIIVVLLACILGYFFYM